MTEILPSEHPMSRELRKLAACMPFAAPDEAAASVIAGTMRQAASELDRLILENAAFRVVVGIMPQGAVRAIAAERERQKQEEGWTLEHDDEHDEGELAAAAGCYCLEAARKQEPPSPFGSPAGPPRLWPWDSVWWKPMDSRRDLVRAGALIVAEIERLDRASRQDETVT